ncbi:MAG: cupin domain-containing protein [Flavobacteriaceae bacterium]
MKIDKDQAVEALRAVPDTFKTFFRHGTLSVEVYKPDKIDLQEPHDRDEVYVIISGSSEFQNGKQKVKCKSGDFLFVPAYQDHRFFNFTDDFATWVIFYGPEGGESESSS